jgi:hypothetical protein
MQAFAGLELIPTLENLALARCKQLTDVSCMRNSRALKKLSLWSTGVTDAGIRGLELIPTLEDLTLDCCKQLTDVSCLQNCRALKVLNLSDSNVTNAGIRGLELIPTLEDLNLARCSDDVSCLRDSRALKKLNLCSTGVTMQAFAGWSSFPHWRISPRVLQATDGRKLYAELSCPEETQPLEQQRDRCRHSRAGAHSHTGGAQLQSCKQVHDLSALRNRPSLRIFAP